MLSANSEEKLIDKIHQSFQKVDFILINPAAYTHTSVALRDALLAVSIPLLKSICLMYISASHSVIILTLVMAEGVICGLGAKGYEFALQFALDF